MMKQILLVLLTSLVVAGCGGDGGKIPASSSTDYVWSFIDGGGLNGINRDPNVSASNAVIVEFNSKLYAMWSESQSTTQIRAAVHDGDGTWTYLDGNLVTKGMNRDSTRDGQSPDVAVLNGKLYATWREGNGTADQIRVVVYNGNDNNPVWSFIDGNGATGLNKSSARTADNPRLAVFESKLYLTWEETNGTATQIRVAVYNGMDTNPSWSFVDGNASTGLNYNTSRNGTAPTLVPAADKLYLAWYESSGSINQIRVAVYNGNDNGASWSFVDGGGATGINKDTSKTASSPRGVEFNGRLYLIWQERITGALDQIRVAYYNSGTGTWTFVDGNSTTGINKDPTKQATVPKLAVYGGNLFAGWLEATAANWQVRAAVYESSSWTIIDGNSATAGLNKRGAEGTAGHLGAVLATSSNLIFVWDESNGSQYQIRVARTQ